MLMTMREYSIINPIPLLPQPSKTLSKLLDEQDTADRCPVCGPNNNGGGFLGRPGPEQPCRSTQSQPAQPDHVISEPCFAFLVGGLMTMR